MTTSESFNNANYVCEEWVPLGDMAMGRVIGKGRDQYLLEGIFLYWEKINHNEGRLVLMSQSLPIDSAQKLDAFHKVYDFINDFINGEFIFLAEGYDEFKYKTLQAILKSQKDSHNLTEFNAYYILVTKEGFDEKLLHYLVKKYSLPQAYQESIERVVKFVMSSLGKTISS